MCLGGDLTISCCLFPQLNICGTVPGCSTKEGDQFAGCELDNGKPVGWVGVDRSLEFSTDGQLKLTYKGTLDVEACESKRL